jgi:hypothetical protein
VVNLRFLHPALPVFIIKELKNCIERLIRVLGDIGKRSTLKVFKEPLACKGYAWHCGGLRVLDIVVNEQPKFKISKFEGTDIVSIV